MENSDKIALVAGTTTSTVTGGTLVAITAGLSGPAANLGGYATAQIVASSIASSVAGPALATTIAAIGGPVVAGGIVVVGTGAIVYGGFKLIRKWLR